MDIEIPNPMIPYNNYLPGTMYHRVDMFSDLIPLAIKLLSKETLKSVGTYRKIILRRFRQLQESSFNYWNEFLLIFQKKIFEDASSYSCRNRIDRFFVNEFIIGIKHSKKLSFYLNYTGEGRTNARLL